MGWSRPHLYEGLTLTEHNRRVLDDLDYFARADGWDKPAPRTPTPSCARAVPAVVPANTAGPTGTAGEAHGDTPRLASTPTPNRRAA